MGAKVNINAFWLVGEDQGEVEFQEFGKGAGRGAKLPHQIVEGSPECAIEGLQSLWSLTNFEMHLAVPFCMWVNN